jgi:hypothetical protein
MELYVLPDRSPFITHALSLLLSSGLVHGLYARRLKLRYGLCYALLHAIIFFSIVKLSNGYYSVHLFYLSQAFVKHFDYEFFPFGLQRMVYDFGVPAAMHGLVASLLLLWLTKKLFARKTARLLRGR